MMHAYLMYYMLDWLAMLASLLAVYLIGNKNRLGFLSFVVANVLWIVLGLFLIHSIGIALGNACFLIMNTRGFLAWERKPVSL
jgi:hypothetical protein